jgi:hypothetical protein
MSTHAASGMLDMMIARVAALNDCVRVLCALCVHRTPLKIGMLG